MLPIILQLIAVLFAPALRSAGYDPPEILDQEPESDATRPPPHDFGLCMGQTGALMVSAPENK